MYRTRVPVYTTCMAPPWTGMPDPGDRTAVRTPSAGAYWRAHLTRGPPQAEFAMGPDGGQAGEAAQESFPDDPDQSPEFDPAEPEPVPEDDFDQSWGE